MTFTQHLLESDLFCFLLRGNRETCFPTSHDSPDRANEGENLGFDSWIIPKTSNSMVNTPANWRQMKEVQVERRKGGGNIIRTKQTGGSNWLEEKRKHDSKMYSEYVILTASFPLFFLNTSKNRKLISFHT